MTGLKRNLIFTDQKSFANKVLTPVDKSWLASLPSQRYSTNFLVSPNSVSQRKMTSLCGLHAHLLDYKVQPLSICLKAMCISFPVNFLHPCLFSCTPFTAKLLNNHLYSVLPFLLSHSLLTPSPLPHLPPGSLPGHSNLVAICSGRSSVLMLPGPAATADAADPLTAP